MIPLLSFFTLLFLSQSDAAKTPSLPHSFHYCVSTAAHQIEGGNIHSDWHQWEQLKGKIKNNDSALIATDSWNHVDEDIAHLVYLGVDNYRFSIEWAKIEPAQGNFDSKEMNRYVDFIQKLHKNGIEPMITLHHFTLPNWVALHGGWEWPGIVEAFNQFVKYSAQKIGPRVSLWITINEPMSVISGGYLSDVFPPGKNEVKSIVIPMQNMVRAHAAAYHTLHSVLDSATFKPKVGIAHHLRVFDPLRKSNPFDHYLARQLDEIFNWAIPEATITGVMKWKLPFTVKSDVFIPEAIQTQDFFGINYYSRDRVAMRAFRNPPIERSTAAGSEVSDLGWEIYPQGLDRLISDIRIRFPKLPIWITENGIADASDHQRIQFISDHVQVIEKQINSGANIEGYCHWTLNDNFEWAEGYSAHFGLYQLEPKTLRRIPTASAEWFHDFIRKTRQQK